MSTLDENLREIAHSYMTRGTQRFISENCVVDALREAAALGAREQREALEAAREALKVLGTHGQWPTSFHGNSLAIKEFARTALTKIDAVLAKEAKE